MNEKINHDSSTIAWNKIGEEWIQLSKNGDSRIHFIMPVMLNMIGNVAGKRILDLGSGDGGYARELSRRGAQVVAIDCSEASINYSISKAKEESLKIVHFIRNGNNLFGIQDDEFDIILCSMFLMDVEDFDGTIKEISRVLKKDGLVFASVLHPCFNGNLEYGIGRQGANETREVVVKNYFEPTEWEAGFRGGSIPVVWRHRTLEDYVKTFLKHGLTIVDLEEPRATLEQTEISQTIAFLRRIPLYLYWKLKK